MKSHDKWQRECLLDAAGELSARRRRALEQALKADPELRAFQRFTAQVKPHVRLDKDSSDWSGFTRERLLAEARRRSPAARREWTASHRQPVWTYAAVSLALLVFGLGWWWLQPHGGGETRYGAAAPYAASPLVDGVPADEMDWALWELQRQINDISEAVDAVTWWVDDQRAEEWARELLYGEES